MTAYIGLFMAAFFAATLIPAQSESVLAGLIAIKSHPVWALIAVASFGNTLGAVVNWWLGRGIEQFKNKSWFPASPQQLAKAQTWYRRYGQWSLLLSWVPFIGDPITVAAGVMRENLITFCLIVGAAKTLRYIFIAGLVAGFI